MNQKSGVGEVDRTETCYLSPHGQSATAPCSLSPGVTHWILEACFVPYINESTVTSHQSPYRLLGCIAAVLAHASVLLLGTGSHMHLSLLDDHPLVVHAHDQAREDVDMVAVVEGDMHDHPVNAVILTALPVRNCELATVPLVSEMLGGTLDQCIEADHNLIPRPAREAPPPSPLAGHSSSFSGIDPPSGTLL